MFRTLTNWAHLNVVRPDDCERRSGGWPVSGVSKPLERRTLLTVTLVKDINTVNVYPLDLTPAGTNLFYVVKDSFGSGFDLAVTTATGRHPDPQGLHPRPGELRDHRVPNLNAERARRAHCRRAPAFISWPATGRARTSSGPAMAPSRGHNRSTFSDPNDPGSTVVSQLTASGDTLFFVTTDPARQSVSPTPTPTPTPTLTPTPTPTPTAYGDDLWAIGSPGAVPTWPPPPSAPSGTDGSFSDTISNLTAFGDGTVNFTVGGELWYGSYELGQGSSGVIMESTGTITNVQQIINFNPGDPALGPVLHGFAKRHRWFDRVSRITSSVGSPPRSIPFCRTYIPRTSRWPARSSSSPRSRARRAPSSGRPMGRPKGRGWSRTSCRVRPAHIRATSRTTTAPCISRPRGAEGEQQLWKSDGTSAGTVLVTDITTPQAAGYADASSYLYSYGNGYADVLQVVNGILYFANSDAAHGNELW